MTYKEIFETMANEIRAFNKSEEKLSLEQMANALTNVNSTVQEGNDHQNETGRNLVEKYPVLPIGEAADLTLEDVLNNWAMYAAYFFQQAVFMIELSSRMETLNGEFDQSYGSDGTPIDPYQAAQDTIIDGMQDAYTAALEQAATLPDQAIMANLANTIRTIPIAFYAELAQGLQQSITEIDMLSFGDLTVKDMAFQEAVTNYCETAVTKLADSYTSVANMGGSVPETEKQKLENLPTAIESIPLTKIQRKEGSFTVTSGDINVDDVGFKPDIVLVTGQLVEEDNEEFEYQFAAVFTEKQTTDENSYCTSIGFTETYYHGLELCFRQTETGFVGYGGAYTSNGIYVPLARIPFNYIAIKYTE